MVKVWLLDGLAGNDHHKGAAPVRVNVRRGVTKPICVVAALIGHGLSGLKRSGEYSKGRASTRLSVQPCRHKSMAPIESEPIKAGWCQQRLGGLGKAGITEG